MPGRYTVYRYDHMDSPAVTAGDSAMLIGAENGLFPAMGYAVPGRMGGLWAGEKKVCEGFFFAIDDVPLRACDAYEVHPAVSAFHYRMMKEGLHVVRRQVVPDGVSGVIIELTIQNLKNVPRMTEVSFCVRTDFLSVAAWRGENGMELGRDVAEYDEKAQAFFGRESRNQWHAVWGAEKGCRVLAADLPREVYGFDTIEGKGVNGRMFYRMRIAARGQAIMRLFVAGGFASKSRAEDALEKMREKAATLRVEKETRVEGMMRAGCVTLPDERIARCWNWTKVYDEWMSCSVPRMGCALSANLPETPSLFGADWAEAVGALLPLGDWNKAQQMIETMVTMSGAGNVPAGRVILEATLGGRVTKNGGAAESAKFVALVHKTLLWSGDRDFAVRMLPTTGLCMSYLLRMTKRFTAIGPELLADVRAAVEGQIVVLKMTGADASQWEDILEAMPLAEEKTPAEDALPENMALWHAKNGHVEQMIGCLTQMAKASLPGLPGAMTGAHAEPGVLMASAPAARLIWPLCEGVFGVKPDAAAKRIVFAPHTPIGWNGWKIEGMTIGSAHFDIESDRVSPSQARYSIRTDEPGWTIAIEGGDGVQEMALGGGVAIVLGD